MKKQDRIQFQRDEDLAAIDEHLDEAISELNAANERIAGLLDEIDGKEPAAPSKAAQGAGDASEGDPSKKDGPTNDAAGNADGESADEAAATC